MTYSKEVDMWFCIALVFITVFVGLRKYYFVVGPGKPKLLAAEERDHITAIMHGTAAFVIWLLVAVMWFSSGITSSTRMTYLITVSIVFGVTYVYDYLPFAYSRRPKVAFVLDRLQEAQRTLKETCREQFARIQTPDKSVSAAIGPAVQDEVAQGRPDDNAALEVPATAWSKPTICSKGSDTSSDEWSEPQLTIRTQPPWPLPNPN